MIKKILSVVSALVLSTSLAIAQVIPIGGGSGGASQTTGSWTPTILGSGGGAAGGYTAQSGRYIKTGTMVHVEFYVRLSSVGTLAGSTIIGGLPFTVANTVPSGACSVGPVQGVTLSGSTVQTVLITTPNATTIDVFGVGSGVSYVNVPISGLTNNALFYASCNYTTT